MFKFLVLSALCGVALSAPQYGRSEGHYEDYHSEPYYSFEYSVNDPHTGDIKSQREQRKGDSTQGEYSLVEPDGSRRSVQYHVEGKSGFLAEVQRSEGHARPSYSSPSYSAPSYSRPSLHQQSSAYRSPSVSSYSQSQPSYSQSSYSSSSSYQSAPSYKSSAPAYNPAPSYRPSYNSQPAYQPSYNSAQSYNSPSYSGHGAATSSVSISTHGAKISTSTKHIIPQRHGHNSY